MTIRTHASIFSGIGGAEIASSQMGWRNVFHCEINPFGRKVLEYWYPNSESYEDITKTDFTKWRGKIDVLTGGFPCQPYSLAGQRKGDTDNRALWPEMLRAIREIQPSWVVGENVYGIMSMVQSGEAVQMGRTGDIFEENYLYREERQYTVSAICEDLERAGYSVQPFVIPACAVGAPHRRDRVWLIARHDASDTDIDRQRNRENKQEHVTECERTPDNSCNGKKGTVTGTNCKLSRTRYNKGKEKWKRKNIRTESFNFTECWTKFPTQPPVCSRDDGGFPWIGWYLLSKMASRSHKGAWQRMGTTSGTRNFQNHRTI